MYVALRKTANWVDVQVIESVRTNYDYSHNYTSTCTCSHNTCQCLRDTCTCIHAHVHVDTITQL